MSFATSGRVLAAPEQVLFGERTIPLKAAAVERRRARLDEKLTVEKDVRAERRAREQDEFYASLGDGGTGE